MNAEEKYRDRKFDQGVRQEADAKQEARFQAQLEETRRQGLLTRLVAAGALVVSASSLVVAILALSRHSLPVPQQSAPILQPVAPVSPRPTNSVSTVPKT